MPCCEPRCRCSTLIGSEGCRALRAEVFCGQVAIHAASVVKRVKSCVLPTYFEEWKSFVFLWMIARGESEQSRFVRLK